MKPLPNQMILPFVCWLLLVVPQATAQAPAPTPCQPFTIPLSDGTTGQALFLPITEGRAYLVYSTSAGQLASYTLTPTNPTPPPDPVPPPPPIPVKLTIAIVENPQLTSLADRQTLADPTWRKWATEKHDFIGIIPNDLIDKRTGQPPPRLAPFLDRARSHNLPWIMFTNPAGVIVWEGQVPTTATELTNLIKQFGG